MSEERQILDGGESRIWWFCFSKAFLYSIAMRGSKDSVSRMDGT